MLDATFARLTPSPIRRRHQRRGPVGGSLEGDLGGAAIYLIPPL